MIEPSCKTCKTWEPFQGVCFNGDSEHCSDFTSRDDSCEHWQRHKCSCCAGCLEAREYHGRFYHHCYSCHFEFPYNPDEAWKAGEEESDTMET